MYLYIPSGKTLATTGANASGQTGAGAGIELAAGNTLYLVGGGTLNATGGNAANGGNGGNGSNAECTFDVSILGGSGGTGGNGGGGAGAGIGTRGGNGGIGGNGGQRNGSYGQETTQYGVDGNAGSAGSTAGAMGNLHAFPSFGNLSATGGNAGSNGTGGNGGLTASQHPGSNLYMASGGGGGGAGGFGGAACNIGTGGPGGGGGGGGAAGNVAWVVYSGTTNGYYYAGAKGGQGGTNGNNTSAPDGAQVWLTNPVYADIQRGGLRPNASDYDDCDEWENGNAWHDGGAGGGCGYISLALWPFLGAGTGEDPYRINSADDWTSFAHNVSNGNNYSGQYVKLTNDISVTTMAGGYQADDNYQPFSGTFDGDGHTLTLNVNNQSRFAAPFKCVSGATIKNLRTAGTIDGTGNADGKLLAGIIGVSFGNTTITRCRSSVTLTTAFGEDAALAGLVAGTKGGSLTIEGCVFDGSMTGASNTRCAGIAGYEYTATTTTISDCLFVPATLTVSTTDDSYTKTFSRDPDATITNCYYTQPLGAAQGTVATASATAPPFLGALLHDYGFVKAYAAGLLMDGNYYYDARLITSESTTLTTGTYTVNGNVTVPSRIQINGTVVLNLSEGATLHAPKGIEVDHNNSANLTINGPGTLTIDSCDYDKSGIGSMRVGTIVINGGTINVKGGARGAGIGGDRHNMDGGYITINGGVVNATGGALAAGIGGGAGPGSENDSRYLGPCGYIIINGGQVTAIGGSSDMGGYNGPGIGPGNNFSQTETGTLTLGWTHSEDFVYSTGYVADPNAPWRTPISQISFVAGKQFMIDGTTTIATEENLKSSGTTKIVPYEAGQQTLSGSGTDGDPYLISSTADWNKFVHNVLDGNSYNSQYVKLMADIDITKCVGVYDDNAANARPFSGTFLGNNHTINDTITDNLHRGTAPFRYISGATIKNLTVAGTIASNQNHTSGLVGFASGTNLIEGCNISATIDINSDYAGGFVGHGLTSTTTIKGCIFSGHYNGRDILDHYADAGNYNLVPVYRSPNNIASFWGWSDSGTPTLEDCLEKGTYTNIGSMHPMGLQGTTGTITNCYYLNPQVGAPSNACTVSGAYRAYTVNTVEGEMLRPLVLVDGNTYYTPCLIAVDDYYHRTGSSVGVTPVVTASNGTPLTLGTDYTATLNGEAVAAFPIVITTLGAKTFTITGLGNCNGSKSISFIVYGFDGEGTDEFPYIISNTDQWDAFASEVNLGNACSGKHVKLTADISVTTMVGYRVNDSDNKPFSGTFDGDGHTITATIEDNSNQGTAPFRYIDGATIRNLTIAGTIASSQYHSSGLVGFASGTNLIEDCIVTATLNIRNNAYVGGLVGHGLSSTTTIRNCIFAGGIYGIDCYPSHAGSFWGWSDNATPTLENCVEMGFYNYRVIGMHPMGLLGGNGALTNCYYKNTPSTNPANAWNVTPNSEYGRIYIDPSDTEIRKQMTSNGLTIYSDNCSVSGVNAFHFKNDIITPVVAEPYNSTPLTLGTNYTVTLDDEPVESFPITLTTIGSHTLVFSGTAPYMGSKSITFIVYDQLDGEGTSENPYTISTTDDWNLFCSQAANLDTYSGKYVKLLADISVSEMVGSNEGHSFQGIFLGNGRTLTFTKGTSESPFGEECCAPFRYVKDATIQDLKVAGRIYTSQEYASGLVVRSYGTTNITNCQVGIVIYSTVYGQNPWHGGVVSTPYGTLNITGCVYNGRLLRDWTGAHFCGGIVSNGSNATINCNNVLYVPSASIPSGWYNINYGYTFVRGGNPTITNCYYTETMGQAQGTRVYSITPGDYVTVANAGAVSNEYSVSGLTFYTVGLQYNDMLYAASGDAVSLNLNSSASSAEYHASAGTLSGSENPYTLTMPGGNVVINMHALQSIGTTVWYAIATPMHDDGQDYESIVNVANLTTDNYDLLRYDEASGTWENQKANGGATGFSTLEPGRGYIYRCSDARTLTYTGVPNSEESYSVSLTASSAAGDLKGFNLVGNPYPFSVTMYRPFYSLGADGIWQAHASGESLEAGQGALVYATSNETLTFYAATRSTNSGMDALPALPKALCLGGNGDDPSNHAISQSVNLPFAHQDGNSIVVTGTGTLQAYDIMGRLLFRMELNTEHLTLNTSLFPSAGVYLLRLGSQSQKIVIR